MLVDENLPDLQDGEAPGLGHEGGVAQGEEEQEGGVQPVRPVGQQHPQQGGEQLRRHKIRPST